MNQSLSPEKGSPEHYMLALVAALLECGHTIEDVRAGLRSLVPSPDVEAARRQALEEAAKVADQKSADLLRRQKEAWPHVHIGALQECCLQIATEIRALAQPSRRRREQEAK